MVSRLTAFYKPLVEPVRLAYTSSMVIGQPLEEHEKKMKLKAYHPILCLIVLAFSLLAGCAATSQQFNDRSQPTDTLAHERQGYGWYSVRFRMQRLDGRTRWENDLLIAHQIAAPLLEAHRIEIDLWRFHRRSAEDDTGHQFRFMIFCSARTARAIYQAVDADPMILQLLSAGVLTEVVTDALDQNHLQTVGAVSDPNWTPVMQDTWPYFIMGVSRMWLGMIDKYSQQVGFPESANIRQLLDHYQQVNVRVTQVWQHESQHALLHHLNAIFGYEAMILREQRWKTF